MYTNSHTVSPLRSKPMLIFVSNVLSHLALTMCPSACLGQPELKTFAVPAPHLGQVDVSTADTGEASTSKPQAPAAQRRVQVVSQLGSSFTPELSGGTTVEGKRTRDDSVESTPTTELSGKRTWDDSVEIIPTTEQSGKRTRDDSVEIIPTTELSGKRTRDDSVESTPITSANQASTGSPTRSYAGAGRAAPISQSERQATRHWGPSPTPISPNTTELPVSKTSPETLTEPTDTSPGPANDSSPGGNGATARKISLHAMEGAVVWRRDLNIHAEVFLWTLVIPEGYGFVVEFHHVEMLHEDRLRISSVASNLRFFVSPGNGLGRAYWHRNSLAPLLVKETKIVIAVYLLYGKVEGSSVSNFNISYTAHLMDSLPQIKDCEVLPTTESLFTYCCTGITDLPKALTCDGIRHCQRGEDEENCPYHAQGCGDWFPYNDQCLKAVFIGERSVRFRNPITPVKAKHYCLSDYGATLASLPDSAGIDIVTELIRKSGTVHSLVGIYKVKPVSRRLWHLYRFLWQWGDQAGSPIAYEQQTLQDFGAQLDCALLDVETHPFLTPVRCQDNLYIPGSYVCMRSNPNRSRETLKLPGIHFPRASAFSVSLPVKVCPDGSVVLMFHGCQWGQLDEDSNSGLSPNNFSLFQCRFGPAVHYSLLCDGIDDCFDKSDEVGCQKPQFSPLLDSTFPCRNLQVIPAEKRCDGINDCFDESDEEFCISCGALFMCPGVGCMPTVYAEYSGFCASYHPFLDSRLKSIAYYRGSVHMDGYGMSRLQAVDKDCAEGFYACRDGYCIPTFLLNNGEKDCRYGDDEDIPVHNMTCPGYYRCQGTGSCVHGDYVCDGIYHCPNKDDERFCHTFCPLDQTCICEGHAYKCSKMFDPLQHLHVRYLDLSHSSNLSLENIHFMEYLSFLNLSFCYLGNINLTYMHQLQILDLSFNSLTELTSLSLHKLFRLTYLDVSNNPFVKTLTKAFTTILQLGELENLKTLIMVNVRLEAVEENVFSPLRELRYLDIRGNPVHSYSKNWLRPLTALEELHTDQPKLCCSYFHPSLSRCYAPVDELSSCSDLLAKDFFRVFLWTFSVLAIVGNAGVLIYRLFVSMRPSPLTFRVLVKNLSASDLLMGVYMMMIGVADVQYRGVYVAKEGEWTKSTACTIAGFLSLVSNEVSAFVICLITLDRVLVLCFPLNSRVHLSSRVTICACCVVWVTGIVLAAVPLLAGIEFYGLNGICLPLPITRRQFSGQTYAFSVFIVLNFVLFLLIGFGQVLIYRAVRSASKAAGSNRDGQDMAIARRLFLVVFTDFCCWFPIGLMGLLAASGTPIPGEVNVWAAIFVLPLNSTLNPFLYTLNGLMEQRKKRRMEKRMRRMIGKLKTEIPKWQPASVQEVMKICLRSKLVDKEFVIRWLRINADSATVVTGKEDLPVHTDAVCDREDVSSITYGSQDLTQNTNVGVCDEVDKNVIRRIDSGK